MGNSADSGIGPVEEQKTGEAVIRNIRRAGGIINDPLLDSYLNHLGYSLVATSPDQDQQFNFFMINDRNINAFALPGGFIGVNYGLIMAAESESELASVLAHEIAHITQRHHARVDAVGSSQIPIVAALIAAMILGANDSEIGEAALATAAASAAQSQINFTRSNEKEADRIGIGMLADAHYSTNAMATFLIGWTGQAVYTVPRRLNFCELTRLIHHALPMQKTAPHKCQNPGYALKATFTMLAPVFAPWHSTTRQQQSVNSPKT